MSAQDRCPDDRIAVYVDARPFADRDALIVAHLFGWHATMTRDEYVAACAAATERTGAEVEPRPDVLDSLPDEDPLAGRLAHAIERECPVDTAPTNSAEKAEDTDDKPGKGFGAAEVVGFVEERFELATDDDGQPIAVPRTGPRIAVGLPTLKHRMQAEIFEELGKTPSTSTIATAFGILTGRAERAPKTRVALRVAERGDELHIDLGTEGATTVRVTRDGWQLDTVPTTFRRTRASYPLPSPIHTAGDARAEFAELLSLDVEGEIFRCLWGWLVASWFADIARPMLWCTGLQGSGKSTRARMVLSLVDPAPALGGTLGKNARDDSTVAAGRHIPTWDNVGTVSAATSDHICRIVTGVTDEERLLYAQGQTYAMTYKRAAIATSILLPHGLQSDAVERLLVVDFTRPDEAHRRTELAIWQAFTAAQPRILGALLDDLAAVLKHRQTVSLDELPRMADYTTILHALDAERGGDHARAYLDRHRRTLAGTAEEDVWMQAVIRLAKTAVLQYRQNDGRQPAGKRGGHCPWSLAVDGAVETMPGVTFAEGWRGTPTELHAAILLLLGDHSGNKPVGRNAIKGQLLQHTVPLAAAGVLVNPEARVGAESRRVIELRWTGDEYALAA
ncbi:hypothetical protein [Flexivirga sp.]|uniref:hypothetical protein n=1 Tax=Flexivirga sp. TaxID=1962927 RepID=UPI003F7F5E83